MKCMQLWWKGQSGPMRGEMGILRHCIERGAGAEVCACDDLHRGFGFRICTSRIVIQQQKLEEDRSPGCTKNRVATIGVCDSTHGSKRSRGIAVRTTHAK